MTPITLLTDFGLQDPYVGLMKAVILRSAPSAALLDLTHAIPAQDVGAGAFWLAKTSETWSGEVVHLAVVDPGVGTRRHPLIVRVEEQLFVAPDNGLLNDVLDWAEQKTHMVEAWAIDPGQLGTAAPRPCGHTFHGRDVFAPAAAQLAAGAHPATLGRPLPARSLARLELPLLADHQARVRVVDRFGNLITDFRSQPEIPLEVLVEGKALRWVRTYGEASPGELVALSGSFGTLELAVAEGNASTRTGLRTGSVLSVRPAIP